MFPLSLSRPRVRYVPDWSGSMRQVAIYPDTTPLQTAQLSANARDPYGVYPYSAGYGFPYRGYMGPYGPPSYFAPYSYDWGSYGSGRPTYLPPEVSPWVHGSFPPLTTKQRGGFSCTQGDCGFKTYGDRAATRSKNGVPVKISMLDADIEDLPIIQNDWPLSIK